MLQSFAILKYLGRKYNLAATSDPEIATEEMVLFQVNELSDRIRQTTHFKKYDSDEAFQKELDQLKINLQKQFELLEKFIIFKKWFTGERLSYVDFFAYEVIDWVRELIDQKCLEKFANLSRFMLQFEQLDNLKEFLASDKYKKGAIFGPSAKIGNTPRN